MKTVLYIDGFNLYYGCLRNSPYKRLEQGRFSWPAPGEAKAKLALRPEAFALLVGGVQLDRCSLKPWYER